jgi:hypothetical protein
MDGGRTRRLPVIGFAPHSITGCLTACAIHNIQQNTPIENVLAFFETIREMVSG